MLSVALLMPVIGYVTYIAEPGSSLFSWHPICMSFAFGGLMMAGVEAVSVSTRRRPGRLTLHWQLQLAAALIAAVGFTVIYVNKERRGAAHFTSLHGQWGAVCLTATAAQLVGGLLALYAARVPNLVAPRVTKTLHALSGSVLAGLGLYTVRLGLDSVWFRNAAALWARPAGDLLLGLSALGLIYRVLVSRGYVKPKVN
ncbi:transmembrane reductase CYB561D2-like [Amphibalanus amphitrite]|uniref:transmembrane reductase CYB561D2-like n=1 Tax=Amphibalanus amphitrite TaxID=1232801 RepID=UPI001C901297|nr:transmembrane reductase CYB561D2-like [Amphibalanus amphitrite]